MSCKLARCLLSRGFHRGLRLSCRMSSRRIFDGHEGNKRPCSPLAAMVKKRSPTGGFGFIGLEADYEKEFLDK